MIENNKPRKRKRDFISEIKVRLLTKPFQDIQRYDLDQGKRWLMNDLYELEKVLD
jgi:hypothetical protein